MFNMTSNLSKFTAALRAVVAETGKPEAAIVNNALKDVAYRAAQFTPKETAAQIRRELTGKRKSLLAKLATIACNNTYGKGQWKKAQHTAMMEGILAARTKSAAALRAGWIPAILAMGGSYRGATVNPRGSAARGGAKKAVPSNLFGEIKNTAVTSNHRGEKRGAGENSKSVAALQQAVIFVTNDRTLYAERKKAIHDILQKHSDIIRGTVTVVVS